MIEGVGPGSVFLNVSSIEASRRFYGELLGLPLLAEPDDHTSIYGLRAGDASLVVHGHGEYAGTRPPRLMDAGATIVFLTSPMSTPPSTNSAGQASRSPRSRWTSRGARGTPPSSTRTVSRSTSPRRRGADVRGPLLRSG
jgi:hypothetical protein